MKLLELKCVITLSSIPCAAFDSLSRNSFWFYRLRCMRKSREGIVDNQFELKKGELGSVISVERVCGTVYLSGIYGTPNDPVYTDLY